MPHFGRRAFAACCLTTALAAAAPVALNAAAPGALGAAAPGALGAAAPGALGAAAPGALGAAATGAHATPQVSAAWARATAPGQTTGAIYLTLTSGTAERLVGASSPDAEAVMLHRSTEAGGTAHMEPVDGLDLPAGQSVTLAPHGLHLMMTGLKHPLAAGSYVTVALSFRQSGNATYNVAVVPIGANGPGAAHG